MRLALPIVLATVICALASAWPSEAQTTSTPVNLARMTLGYTYFNQPGANLATHDADVIACALEAAKVRSLDERLDTPANGVLEGVLAPIIQGALAKAAHHGLAAASLENCMVVRGWRVVLLPDAEGQALSILPPADLGKHLEAWVGADEPHGQIVRVWGNDAANALTTRYGMRPDHTNNGQLSLIAATASDLKQFEPTAPPAKAKAQPVDSKWPTKPLKPTELATAPAEGGTILIRIKNLSFHGGIGIFLNRMGPDRNSAPSLVDHGPDVIAAAKGMLFAHKEGDMFALAVPAGRWRIYGTLSGLQVLNFCLGSPSFELKPGEVVYAGTFNLSAGDLAPDLELSTAHDWLAGQPQSEMVKAAVYTNGAQGTCGDNSIYALEFKGAPFAPDYAWGSARHAIVGVAR